MKVLVSFKPNRKYDNFEGTRMRKSVKGALELLNIKHTDSGIDFFDVAHIFSPDQEGEMNEYHDNGAPVVVSALYSEDDPYASFTELKTVQEKRYSVLTNKALKFLNKADLVLVPCESAKQFLIDNGETSKIERCILGMNMSRFDFSKEEEKEIFYRYYRENRDKKLVIAVGEYSGKMDGVTSFINAAKKSPNAVFYYFGRFTFKSRFNIRLRRFMSQLPKNVRFVDIPPDDIYRSALLNASVYMVPGYKITGQTSLVEAMAARCQIIARKSAVFDGLLEAGVTAYIAEFGETLSSLTKDYLEGKIKPTTTQAYQQVSLYSLNTYGENLNKYYQLAIKDNVNRRL